MGCSVSQQQRIGSFGRLSFFFFHPKSVEIQSCRSGGAWDRNRFGTRARAAVFERRASATAPSVRRNQQQSGGSLAAATAKLGRTWSQGLALRAAAAARGPPTSSTHHSHRAPQDHRPGQLAAAGIGVGIGHQRPDRFWPSPHEQQQHGRGSKGDWASTWGAGIQRGSQPDRSRATRDMEGSGSAPQADRSGCSGFWMESVQHGKQHLKEQQQPHGTAGPYRERTQQGSEQPRRKQHGLAEQQQGAASSRTLRAAAAGA